MTKPLQYTWATPHYCSDCLIVINYWHWLSSVCLKIVLFCRAYKTLS